MGVSNISQAFTVYFPRFAMTTLIQRLGWRSVAALTADGEEYTDYMASLQV